jgi:hypothetical protein
MPVNLIKIQNKLADFSAQISTRKQQIAIQSQEIADLMAAYADRLEDLKDQVNRAADLVPHLRCAYPIDEPLNTAFSAPLLPEKFTVMAADGSQINPSRHTRVEFCVINVGVVKMVRGSGRSPEIYTQSQLLDYDSLFLPRGGMISESMVALMRDLREREALVDLAGELTHPAVSMTDGPLELYREPQESRDFSQTLDRYLSVLSRLHDHNLMTLGYVDKPGSDLIARLLELVGLSDGELQTYNQRKRQFAGLSDIYLLGKILGNPGDRSAIFGIHSQTANQFKGNLALHFFYLNVGQPGKPHLARVEVPGWIAQDKAALGLLQAVLIEQARVMGTRPYPYILHRAHEEAIVSIQEHERVEDMIVAECQRRGIPIDEKSYKQYHKDLPTSKTRYLR